MMPASCWICQNARIYPEYAATWEEPGEEAYIECDLDLPDEVAAAGDRCGWDTEKMPDICGQFVPEIVECACSTCRKRIPATEVYGYVLYMYENLPVCSADCEERAESEAAREIDGLMAVEEDRWWPREE